MFKLKLAFSTLSCEAWSASEMIAYCKQYDYTGLELREGQETFASLAIPRDVRASIAELFHQSGVVVTDIGSSICVKGVSEAETAKALAQLAAIAEMAEDFSAKGIRIFLGNFARRKDDPKVQLGYGRIVSFLQTACDFTLSRNLELWIETHNEFATGKVLNKLLQDVGRNNCKIIWDVIHPLEDGESPEETLSYIGDRCAHVHIKDGIPSGDPNDHDWKYTPIGSGAIPIGKIINLLMGIGFQGFFSLEWERKWRQELQLAGMEPEVVIPKYPDDLYKLN
jgi:sugar phosphate isomerase/epimerase